MGYLFNMEKMLSIIDVGTKGKMNGKDFVFLSKIDKGNQYKCYLLIDGIKKCYCFETLYKKELIDKDENLFKDDLLRSPLEKMYDDYFLKFNSILLTLDTTQKEMENVYFSDSTEECFECIGNNKEPCWAKYEIACGNRKYYANYHDKYNAVTKEFFSIVFENTLKPLKKELYTIVLVGCGNLYELEVINDFLEGKEYQFNVIILDLGLWQENQFNAIKDNLRIKNIWFKKCDFTHELQNQIYDSVDLIYYSRCIIPVDIKTKENLNDILLKTMRKKNKPFIAISQVVNPQNEYSVDFENKLRDLIKNRIVYSFKTDKMSFFWNCDDERICKYMVNGRLWEFTIVKDDMKPIGVENDLLHFYLYVMKGRN